ncbi:PREDICTED: group IID secretory phospholipase A2 [Propithecus coquereli]|uniref:group IID secretory phospholipase A2 n=1 Tax=Propithecus coquereli TaxID=379532 RepID=UPI00063F8D93|nr:PREDICTED: group IID secretory phospholipase A2 [Propithecus coquereli]
MSLSSHLTGTKENQFLPHVDEALSGALEADDLCAVAACVLPLPPTSLLGCLAGVMPAQGGILNLNKMIKQVTGKIPLFSYWPYGCYCGLGGRGQPKDATDWCCKVHDCCYAHLRFHRCALHMDHYRYNFSHGVVQCSDKGTWCEQKLCACDKEVAFCLKRNLDTYNKHLRFYWRPHCNGPTPNC